MNEKFKKLLEDLSQHTLTAESFKAIETAVEELVNERVQLAVEAKEQELDEQASAKMEFLIESIDEDHGKKFAAALKSQEDKYLAKLKTLQDAQASMITENAAALTNNLITSISDFIDLQLESVIPTEEIKKAVSNKRADKLIGDLRKLLVVESSASNELVKEALTEGRNEINRLTKERDEAIKLVTESTKKLDAVKASAILEEKLAKVPTIKKNFIRKTLANRSSQYITENFDYVSKLFDKKEEEAIDVLRESTSKQTQDVKVVTESVEDDDDTDNGSKRYMSAFDTEY